MEVPEYRDDGSWELLSGDRHSVRKRSRLTRWLDPDALPGPVPRPDRDPPAPRPRFWGWSIVLTACANIFFMVITVTVGASIITLASWGAVVLICWLLMMAETLSLRSLYRNDRAGDNDSGGRDQPSRR